MRPETHENARFLGRVPDGCWVPDFDSRWQAAVAEHRLRDLERDLSMAELELAMLGISSRR